MNTSLKFPAGSGDMPEGLQDIIPELFGMLQTLLQMLAKLLGNNGTSDSGAVATLGAPSTRSGGDVGGGGAKGACRLIENLG